MLIVRQAGIFHRLFPNAGFLIITELSRMKIYHIMKERRDLSDRGTIAQVSETTSFIIFIRLARNDFGKIQDPKWPVSK
jgi:hypothetical protein